MILLHFGIPPAFEYVAAVEQWFWPVVGVSSLLGLLCLAVTCRN